MQEETEITLNNFYIFNPLLGSKEGEEEKKILFYYPSRINSTVQIKNVGLSEAIIKFTQNFISKEECKSVHTLKTRRYFYKPENDYWIVMTINVPFTKAKDGGKEAIYHSENIHDDVYHAIVKQSYEMYKLFVGSFSTFTYEENGISILKRKLQQFYSRYLSSLKVSNCDIIDVFEGMQFLPLDKKTYLHARSFVNEFQDKFSEEVHFTAFLVKNHLVWSNIESDELRVIYRYLVTNLLAPFITDNNSEEVENSYMNDDISPELTNSDSSLGRFIATRFPKLFIKNEGKSTVYQILVYNVLSSFMCLFVPENVELSQVFLNNLKTFLKKKMVATSSELCLQAEKKRSTGKNTSSSGGSFSYIYFNKLNLAQKNTLRNDKTLMIPKILSILNDICFDKKRNSPSGEIIMKTYDDHWIIGQFCNERDFYVITQPKNTTLLEMSEEMKKICEKQLRTIYFHV